MNSPSEDLSGNATAIIAAYNEAASIGGVVRQLREALPALRVLVVDDGSEDDTGAVAETAGAEVIRHGMNLGYGASLAAGIRAADSEFVVFIDGDGQHDVNDVQRLLAEIEDYDMVVGARGKASHAGLRRRPGKTVLALFANYLARQRIPDVNSGLRAFRREVLLHYLHLMPKGFSFSTTSTFAMLKGGRRIKWVPIETGPRVGASTVRQLRHGPETLMVMLRLTVLFDPLRVFLPVSGLLMFLAAVMTVLNFVFYRSAVPATAVFLGMSSVMVFMMALVTDQVSAMRRESFERT